MKLSVASAGSRRDNMRKKQGIERIGAPVIRARYPALGSLQLDFKFVDQSGFLHSPQVMVFHPPAPAYFRFACPYSDCDGEFNLTQQVDQVVGSHEHSTSGQVRCAGARHSGVACTLSLEYSVSPTWR